MFPLSIISISGRVISMYGKLQMRIIKTIFLGNSVISCYERMLVLLNKGYTPKKKQLPSQF